jgi:hypothetical protein
MDPCLCPEVTTISNGNVSGGGTDSLAISNVDAGACIVLAAIPTIFRLGKSLPLPAGRDGLGYRIRHCGECQHNYSAEQQNYRDKPGILRCLHHGRCRQFSCCTWIQQRRRHYTGEQSKDITITGTGNGVIETAAERIR